MKKIIFIVCSFLIVLTATAQHKRGVKFGVQAGMNVSDLITDISYIDPFNTGAQFGVSVDVPLRGKYWLSTGVNYAQLGKFEPWSSEMTSFFELPAFSIAHRYNYLQIPILVSMRQKHFRADAGLYGGYMLNGYEQPKTNNEATHAKQPFFQNALPEVRRYDAGLQLGIGYMTKFGIDIMLNTQHGFVNLTPIYSRFPINASNIMSYFGKTFNLGLNVGYRF